MSIISIALILYALSNCLLLWAEHKQNQRTDGWRRWQQDDTKPINLN